MSRRKLSETRTVRLQASCVRGCLDLLEHLGHDHVSAAEAVEFVAGFGHQYLAGHHVKGTLAAIRAALVQSFGEDAPRILNARLSKADADTVVDAVFSTIADTLATGESVAIAGFGAFTTKARAARQGRNPQTGEAIAIAASTVPTFKAGKALRDAVRN